MYKRDMNEFPDSPLFQPDPAFAAEWFVDDPLAQGALRHASVTVLEALESAREAAADPSPDLGDIGPLGIFPRSIRPAVTPLLVDKIRTAATIVGWKLAQPGPAIAPGCIGEELALELIRQEAVSILDLVDAPRTSIDATRGVYEVCEDDDVLDLFNMEEPADAAVALTDPISLALGKSDMRIEAWFNPFYSGRQGFGSHAFYLEQPASLSAGRAELTALRVVEPEAVSSDRPSADGREFRVCIRMWEDTFLDRDPMDQMPDTWMYYMAAASADEARAAAFERFPNGAASFPVYDDVADADLNQGDLARISIDVQRLHLPQQFKDGTSFHVVGTLVDLAFEHLARLAGHLAATFTAAVVAKSGEKGYVAVNVNAESHDEALADLEDALRVYADAEGIGEDLIDGCSSGQGARDAEELLAEIRAYDVPD
jgi:hypothetical protein